MLKNMGSRISGGEGGKGDLEKSRFDWVFLNGGVPNCYLKMLPPSLTIVEMVNGVKARDMLP